jgi:hypothetical protein
MDYTLPRWNVMALAYELWKVEPLLASFGMSQNLIVIKISGSMLQRHLLPRI